MKTTITQHLYMYEEYTADYRGKEWVPNVHPYQLDDEASRIYIAPINIDVVIPDDFNPVPAQVAALNAEHLAALKAYQETAANINERLSKLQALTFEPSEVTA